MGSTPCPNFTMCMQIGKTQDFSLGSKFLCSLLARNHSQCALHSTFLRVCTTDTRSYSAPTLMADLIDRQHSHKVHISNRPTQKSNWVLIKTCTIICVPVHCACRFHTHKNKTTFNPAQGRDVHQCAPRVDVQQLQFAVLQLPVCHPHTLSSRMQVALRSALHHRVPAARQAPIEPNHVAFPCTHQRNTYH